MNIFSVKQSEKNVEKIIGYWWIGALVTEVIAIIILPIGFVLWNYQFLLLGMISLLLTITYHIMISLADIQLQLSKLRLTVLRGSL